MTIEVGTPTRARSGWASVRTRQRFLRMLGRFFSSEVGGKAKWLFAGLVVLLLAINGLNVVNSYVGRNFMTSLETRAVSRFILEALLYLAVFSASTAADVFLRFTEETLALTWRAWLAQWVVQRYLKPPVYHRLSDRLIASGEIANPDERIADDVRAFTATTISFAILLLNGTFTIVAFSGVLWSISPPLFLVAILYAGAGSVLAIARGRPLVKLNVAQLDKEANFRSELIHVRENAEPLAIARREDRILTRVSRRIKDLVANFRRIILVNRNLGFFTTGYNYLIQIIPTLIVAPLFIRGQVEFGVVTQSSMAFAQLVGACSLIIDQFQSISSYAAVVTRLGVLDEGIEQALARPVLADEVCRHRSRRSECPLCSDWPLPASAIEVLDGHAEDRIIYDQVTLLSPADGRVLTKDLSGSVSSGSWLLVLGANIEAKSALFRATAGTWSLGGGRLIRPGNRRMLFLAERPYLPPGTLREVLTSPDRESATSDDQILARLRDVTLEPLLARVGGLDVERRWDNVLSLGEQQLLAFAQVLLATPLFVFLERPGTTLGKELLDRMLELLSAHSISVLTIGTAEDRRHSYHAVLELERDGAWRWSPLCA